MLYSLTPRRLHAWLGLFYALSFRVQILSCLVVVTYTRISEPSIDEAAEYTKPSQLAYFRRGRSSLGSMYQHGTVSQQM